MPPNSKNLLKKGKNKYKGGGGLGQNPPKKNRKQEKKKTTKNTQQNRLWKSVVGNTTSIPVSNCEIEVGITNGITAKDVEVVAVIGIL